MRMTSCVEEEDYVVSVVKPTSSLISSISSITPIREDYLEQLKLIKLKGFNFGFKLFRDQITRWPDRERERRYIFQYRNLYLSYRDGLVGVV